MRRMIVLSLLSLLMALACQRDRDQASADPTPKKPPRAVPVPRREPAKHRAVAERCPKSPTVDAHEKVYFMKGAACTADLDCIDATKARSGRCSRGRCTFDECYVDSDCKK